MYLIQNTVKKYFLIHKLRIHCHKKFFVQFIAKLSAPLYVARCKFHDTNILPDCRILCGHLGDRKVHMTR